MWEESERYPDPRVISLDPSFDAYRLALASVERIATGFRWAEGPVWFGDGRYLLWSDIPNNRIMKWEEETGTVAWSVANTVVASHAPSTTAASRY